jgi:hypothetical protein
MLALCEADQTSEHETLWKQGAWLTVQATAERSTNMIGEKRKATKLSGH